ncbi:MAG TPA: ice-binding family protein [Gemmatimonadaceae bacterium]
MKSVMQGLTVRALGQRARIARVMVAVAFAGLFAAGCKSTSEPGLTSTITISPTSVTLAPGGTQQFTVVAKNADGDILAIPDPIWAVSGGGGTITSTGLYTAGTTAGTFTNSVSVTCNGVTASATIIITPGPLTTITVTPNPTLLIGATQQFTAVGHDANGNVVAITPVWSTVNPPGTIVAASGLFTAGNTTGTFPNSVRATSGTIFGTATVTVIASPPPSAINLGTASTYGILAGSTVTCAGAPGTVNADVGISPGAALTGFPPCTISGSTHLADAPAAQAQLDLTTAYNTLAGLPCGTVVGTANIGGTTRPAGVYCSASSILVTGDLTLDGGGDPNAVFVFQAGSTITTAGNIILINGAQAKNVYWQVGSSATIGGGPATWRGNILALTTITLNNNITLIGRALARNGAVTMGTSDTITLP